jgi:phasin family protein
MHRGTRRQHSRRNQRNHNGAPGHRRSRHRRGRQTGHRYHGGKAQPHARNENYDQKHRGLLRFGQANVEAFVKSGQIWAAGLQELTKLFATTTKASFDESVATFKAISSAKSVTEAIDLQSTFATSVVEKALAESNKLINTSIKLTEQTLAPITARMTVAAETFGKAA